MQLINSQPAPTEPHVVIVEQPASHKLRFRYECEGRGAGALQGATSTAEKKMFPKIQIRGYTGPAVVVVSCVTHDSDKPKAHPHMLVSPASVSRNLSPQKKDLQCSSGHCVISCSNRWRLPATGFDNSFACRSGRTDAKREFALSTSAART